MFSADTSTPKVFYTVMPIPSKKISILVLKLFGMLHGLSKSGKIGKECVCKYQNVGGSDRVGGLIVTICSGREG